MDSTSSNNQLSLPIKIVFSLITLLVIGFATELTLRLIDPDLYFKNQFFPLNRDIDFPEIYERDSDLFWRFRPDFETNSERFSALRYSINSRGMRGGEFETKSSGYRIVALGNSCTFGWGVYRGETFSSRLQELLRGRFPDGEIEVLNAGVPGYTSHQGAIYFEKDIINLDPDLVLIMFGWNDQFSAGRGITDRDQQIPARFVLTLQNVLAKSKTYQLMRKVVLSLSDEEKFVRLDESVGVRRVSLAHFKENLERIVSTARAHGIEPVLLVPPVASLDNYFDGTISQFHFRHETYQAQIVRVAEYQQVALVNLQQPFDERYDLFDDARADPVHFNSRGHEVIARAIAPVIDSILGLD